MSTPHKAAIAACFLWPYEYLKRFGNDRGHAAEFYEGITDRMKKTARQLVAAVMEAPEEEAADRG